MRVGLILAIAMVAASSQTSAQDSEVIKETGGWRLSTETDIITDEVSHLLSIHDREERAMLLLSCSRDRGRNSVNFDLISIDYFGPNDIRLSRLRVDENETERASTFYTSDAARLTRARDIRRTVTQLMEGTRFIYRAYGSNSRSFTYIFDVEGAAEVIPQLYSLCEDRLPSD